MWTTGRIVLAVFAGVSGAIVTLSYLFTTMQAVSILSISGFALLIFFFCVVGLLRSVMQENDRLSRRMDVLEQNAAAHHISLRADNIYMEYPRDVDSIESIEGLDLAEEAAPGAEENDVSDLPPD